MLRDLNKKAKSLILLLIKRQAHIKIFQQIRTIQTNACKFAQNMHPVQNKAALKHFIQIKLTASSTPCNKASLDLLKITEKGSRYTESNITLCKQRNKGHNDYHKYF